MRVALSQMEAGSDKAANLSKISAATGRAANAGAQLIVFPEAAMFYSRDLDSRQLLAAERLDGPFGRKLGELARDHRIAIVCGVFEQAGGDSVYNTVVVYGPDGSRIGEYRKIHLFDAFDRRESDLVEAGEGDLCTFKLQGLTFGLMNAYDVRFPELARELVVDLGAQVLLLPAAWVRGTLKEDHWEVLVRARAIENTAYVLAADQVGQDCCGSSMIVDPMGVPLARGGETAQLVLGDVSPERVREVRRRNPSLENRRLQSIVPELVGLSRPAPALPPLAAEDTACAACGFRFGDVSIDEARRIIGGLDVRYRTALARRNPDRLRLRPAAQVWSPIEYACHVRDVLVTHVIRLYRARTEEDPALEPMLNDLRAARLRYRDRDLGPTLDELGAAALGLLEESERLREADWSRPVHRLPGERRSARWLLRNAAHEGLHHLGDLGGAEG